MNVPEQDAASMQPHAEVDDWSDVRTDSEPRKSKAKEVLDESIEVLAHGLSSQALTRRMIEDGIKHRSLCAA